MASVPPLPAIVQGVPAGGASVAGSRPASEKANPVGAPAASRGERSTCGPISLRWAKWNRPPCSSVSARCEAQVTGKPPRSARKTTSSNPNVDPSAARRWPV